MVQAGSFRQDLYYRLNVIDVRVPPLRERREDIPDIAAALLRKITADSGESPPAMDPDFLHRLQNLPLAGNMRELENTLHRCWALSNGKTLDATLLQDTPEDIEPFIAAPTTIATCAVPEVQPENIAPTASTSIRNAVSSSLADRPLLADEVAFPCDLDAFVSAHEKALLLRALHQVQFNRTAAAALLGLNLRQIRYRMERLGIVDNDKGEDGIQA